VTLIATTSNLHPPQLPLSSAEAELCFRYGFLFRENRGTERTDRRTGCNAASYGGLYNKGQFIHAFFLLLQ